MLTSTLLSLTALLLTSLTTALPTASAGVEMATIHARVALSAADKKKYLDYKEAETHALTVVLPRKDAAAQKWMSAKAGPAKTAAKNELDATAKELCAIWTA